MLMGQQRVHIWLDNLCGTRNVVQRQETIYQQQPIYIRVDSWQYSVTEVTNSVR